MKLKELKDYIELSDFDTFKTIINSGNRVKAIKCPNASSYSRKVIDELTDWLKKYYNAKGLAWMKCNNNILEGGISKFFNKDLQNKIINELSIKDNEILFIIGDKQNITLNALGALRVELAKRNNLIKIQYIIFLVVISKDNFSFNKKNQYSTSEKKN